MDINSRKLIESLILENEIISTSKTEHLFNDLLDIFSNYLLNYCKIKNQESNIEEIMLSLIRARELLTNIK